MGAIIVAGKLRGDILHIFSNRIQIGGANLTLMQPLHFSSEMEMEQLPYLRQDTLSHTTFIICPVVFNLIT